MTGEVDGVERGEVLMRSSSVSWELSRLLYTRVLVFCELEDAIPWLPVAFPVGVLRSPFFSVLSGRPSRW